MNKYSTECKPEVMDSEDPLFMLYTSGSTGKPKGLVHTQAGYLLQVALSHQVLSIILRTNKYRFKPKISRFHHRKARIQL